MTYILTFKTFKCSGLFPKNSDNMIIIDDESKSFQICTQAVVKNINDPKSSLLHFNFSNLENIKTQLSAKKEQILKLIKKQ